MANTQAPKGTKAKTKVTFSDGSTGYVTEGGQYRIDSGPNKGKLWQGAVPGETPAAGAAGTVPVGAATPPAPVTPAITAAAATPVNNQNTVNAPTQLSPQGTEYLTGVKNDLQSQVAQGAISQAIADQEYTRRQNQAAAMSPGQQQAAAKSYQDMKAGKIDLGTFDKQLYANQVAGDQTSPQPAANTPLETTSDVIKAVSDTAANTTQAGNLLTNPNQNNAFGSSTTTIDPITGQPVVNQTLSGANQKSLEGIQGTGVAASDVAKGLIGNQYGQFVQGAGPQSGYNDPALEQSIYSRLTRDFGDKFGREEEQLSQTLANRGIPVGSQAYTNAMGDFRKNRDSQYETAQNNAVQQGTATALTRQQNNIGGLGALTSGVGTLSGVGQGGFYQPQFQGFNSVAYNQPDVQGLYGTQFAGQLTREQIAGQIEQQKIQAGATLGAAGKAAEASKANTAANIAANKENKPESSSFTTAPPGK